jgi:hypothetical protein
MTTSNFTGLTTPVNGDISVRPLNLQDYFDRFQPKDSNLIKERAIQEFEKIRESYARFTRCWDKEEPNLPDDADRSDSNSVSLRVLGTVEQEMLR